MSHREGMAFPARYAFAPFGGQSGRVRPAADSTGSAYARRDVRYRIVTSGSGYLGFLEGHPEFYPDLRVRFMPPDLSCAAPSRSSLGEPVEHDVGHLGAGAERGGDGGRSRGQGGVADPVGEKARG